MELIEGDLSNFTSLVRAVETSRPDEIYNLGGISLVSLSYEKPELVQEINGNGLLRLLEATKEVDKQNKIKIYQASSSEMFGKVKDMPQNEDTLFNPISPYGKSKVFAHEACIKYRKKFDMYISCGILYNHESEYRAEHFVSRKITKGVSQIAKGKLDKIRLGTLEPKRDWGYAGDYVEAMWLMLQQEKPNDFVIATGKTHSVKNFLEIAIKYAGLGGGVEDYVTLDDEFKRPLDLDILVGDSTKAKKVLGWEPKISFNELVLKMVAHDLKS